MILFHLLSHWIIQQKKAESEKGDFSARFSFRTVSLFAYDTVVFRSSINCRISSYSTRSRNSGKIHAELPGNWFQRHEDIEKKTQTIHCNGQHIQALRTVWRHFHHRLISINTSKRLQKHATRSAVTHRKSRQTTTIRSNYVFSQRHSAF